MNRTCHGPSTQICRITRLVQKVNGPNVSLTHCTTVSNYKYIVTRRCTQTGDRERIASS